MSQGIKSRVRTAWSSSLLPQNVKYKVWKALSTLSLKYTSSSTLSLLIHSECKTVAEKVIGDIELIEVDISFNL